MFSCICTFCGWDCDICSCTVSALFTQLGVCENGHCSISFCSLVCWVLFYCVNVSNFLLLMGHLRCNFTLNFITCMHIFPVCVSVHHMCAWCPGSPEEGAGCPGTRATNGLSHCVAAGSPTQVLEECPLLLTAKPSLQHCVYFWYLFYFMCFTACVDACVPGVFRGHKSVLSSLKLELWIGWVTVGAGNWSRSSTRACECS